MKQEVTVLVVDDEHVVRNLLEKILTKEGYRVVTADDGDSALDVIKRDAIDIVLTDMKMPSLGGFELLKYIRSHFKHVGVIIMTAYGDTYTIKDALLLGADEYVTKPFNRYEIAMIVERAYWRILSSRSQSRELATERQ